MSGFLFRLAARSLGATPVVRPRATVFAAGSDGVGVVQEHVQFSQPDDDRPPLTANADAVVSEHREVTPVAAAIDKEPHSVEPRLEMPQEQLVDERRAEPLTLSESVTRAQRIGKPTEQVSSSAASREPAPAKAVDDEPRAVHVTRTTAAPVIAERSSSEPIRQRQRAHEPPTKSAEHRVHSQLTDTASPHGETPVASQTPETPDTPQPLQAPLAIAITERSVAGIAKQTQARRQPIGPPSAAHADHEPHTINVTIGRVEVRASPAPVAPNKGARQADPAPSALDDYLRNRHRGSGR